MPKIEVRGRLYVTIQHKDGKQITEAMINSILLEMEQGINEKVKGKRDRLLWSARVHVKGQKPPRAISDGDFVMPVGTHSGKSIEEIPSGYLKWLAENWEGKTDWERKIMEECDKEWQWREDNNCHINEDD